MSSASITAQDVAAFLQENPEFFREHADVFAALEVPHPHQAHAISLGERQIMTLRERTRELEWRLAELVRNATANESISERLNRWCGRMLAEKDPQRVPGAIALGLAEQFDIADIALRVWGLGELPDTGYGEAVSEDVRTFADSLKTPYCGTDTEFEAAGWLGGKPASLAIVALRPAAEASAFGLLVMGSDDPERFSPEMGTAFLETLGNLASSALCRLKPDD